MLINNNKAVKTNKELVKELIDKVNNTENPLPEITTLPLAEVCTYPYFGFSIFGRSYAVSLKREGALLSKLKEIKRGVFNARLCDYNDVHYTIFDISALPNLWKETAVDFLGEHFIKNNFTPDPAASMKEKELQKEERLKCFTFVVEEINRHTRTPPEDWGKRPNFSLLATYINGLFPSEEIIAFTPEEVKPEETERETSEENNEVKSEVSADLGNIEVTTVLVTKRNITGVLRPVMFNFPVTTIETTDVVLKVGPVEFDKVDGCDLFELTVTSSVNCDNNTSEAVLSENTFQILANARNNNEPETVTDSELYKRLLDTITSYMPKNSKVVKAKLRKKECSGTYLEEDRFGVVSNILELELVVCIRAIFSGLMQTS